MKKCFCRRCWEYKGAAVLSTRRRSVNNYIRYRHAAPAPRCCFAPLAGPDSVCVVVQNLIATIISLSDEAEAARRSSWRLALSVPCAVRLSVCAPVRVRYIPAARIQGVRTHWVRGHETY